MRLDELHAAHQREGSAPVSLHINEIRGINLRTMLRAVVEGRVCVYTQGNDHRALLRINTTCLVTNIIPASSSRPCLLAAGGIQTG